MALVLAGYLALLAAGLAANTLVLSLGGPSQAEMGLLPFTAAITTGGGAALTARLQNAEHATRSAHDEVSWRLSRTRQQLWVERRRLGIALHGQVQAALTACEFLIRHHLAQLSDGVTPAPLPPALALRLDAALLVATNLEEPSARETIAGSLSEVTGTWADVFPLDLEITPEAHIALDEDPDCRDATVEAARELLLNAARHGHPSAAQLKVYLWSPHVVEVILTEESHGASSRPTSAPGFGHHLLDSISLGWSSIPTPLGRISRVRLAVAAGPGGQAGAATGP